MEMTMTREEMVSKLADLRAQAEALVQTYNAANQAGEVDVARKANSDLDEVIGQYTNISRTMVFEDCKATDDPLLEAVKRLTFPSIATKDSKVEDTAITVRELVDREKQIDPLKLSKYCGGIGADKSWPFMVEKFNMLMTARKATELGIDPAGINDSYAMSEISKEIKLGKTPASNTKVLAILQTIIAAMLGEETGKKANSHDVNFLLSIYSKKGRKALTVTCANHKFMRGYVMEICHRIVTGKTYDVEYKKAK